MSDFGLNTRVDPEAAISELPGSIFLELRDKLNTNPQDKDWRALVRCVENRYRIKPMHIEQMSVNTNGQAAGNILTELSQLGMTIGELAGYLRKMNIDTYRLGLAPYESVQITEQPDEFQETYEGGSLIITVKATGNPLPCYQWFFCKNETDDFLPLRGRIENNLRIDNLTSTDAGTYACQIHNCGDPDETKNSSHCLVSVKPDPTPQFRGLNPLPVEELAKLNTGPRQPLPQSDILKITSPDHLIAQKLREKSSENLIIRHPQDVTVGLNGRFSLSVETHGNPPIHYQWYRGNIPLQQHSSKLEMTVLSKEDFGDYYCIVKNGHIIDKSRVARVSEMAMFPHLTPEIEIVSQPQSLKKVAFGASAIFSCEARCGQPLRYQWFKDGTPLLDKTSPEIKFMNIQDRSVEGGYQCEISVNLPGNDRYRKMTVFAYLSVEIPQVYDNVQYNPSDKVALLIGNSDYRSEQNLNAPQYDVQTLQELFLRLDFKVVSLLNLTKPEIENAVLEFCNLVDKNVYCVFYFAGHGFEEDGLSYLVPTDAPSGYKCDECVCADAVLDNIQKKQPPLILMVLDICRKRNRVSTPRHSLPHSLERKADRGNTVFCYATSVGLNAFEPRNQRCNGLLVGHLCKLLTKNIGIDALISELKEEFNSNEKHRKSQIQIPELRSNLVEPRRSLADKISTQGETQIFQERTLRWRNAHEKPGTQEILFPDVGVYVQLTFQSEYSNILHVYTRVLNKGIADKCVAWTANQNPSISIEGRPKIVKPDDPVTTKVTLLDIQKLQNHLCVDVYIDCNIKGGSYKFKTARNLGFPLVSKMKLWEPREHFLPARREAIEQTEDSFTSSLEN